MFCQLFSWTNVHPSKVCQIPKHINKCMGTIWVVMNAKATLWSKIRSCNVKVKEDVGSSFKWKGRRSIDVTLLGPSRIHEKWVTKQLMSAKISKRTNMNGVGLAPSKHNGSNICWWREGQNKKEIREVVCLDGSYSSCLKDDNINVHSLPIIEKMVVILG